LVQLANQLRVIPQRRIVDLVVMAEIARKQVDFASQIVLFQTLIACDILTVDRREVTIEAGPQLANRRRWRVSHRSAELGIASDSEPGT
jgi:hypothetical protein